MTTTFMTILRSFRTIFWRFPKNASEDFPKFTACTMTFDKDISNTNRFVYSNKTGTQFLLLSPVHITREKLEKGVLTLASNAHNRAGEILFVFEENSGREITRSSCRHRFQKALGLVVRKLVNDNPGLKVNRSIFFLLHRCCVFKFLRGNVDKALGSLRRVCIDLVQIFSRLVRPMWPQLTSAI